MMDGPAGSPPRRTNGRSVAVEQSLAIAVQDATDFLRATMTLAIGAFGAGTAQFLATGDTRFLNVIDSSQKNIDFARRTLAETLTLIDRLSCDVEPFVEEPR